MPRGIQPEGSFYHVMVRGNWGKGIFEDKNEAHFFQELLLEAKDRTTAKIHSNIIMPNHAHLLVQIGREPLSALMAMPMARFGQRYNWRRGLTGHVFQDRFKAKLCADERYLMALIRYIPRNPVRAGLVASPRDWPLSSYHAYLGKKDPLVTTDFCLSLFGAGESAVREFREFVESDLESGLPPVEDFPGHEDAAPVPGVSSMGRLPDIAELIENAATALGVPLEALKKVDRGGRLARERKALIKSLQTSGFTLRDIARAMGLSINAVWKSGQG